MVVGVLEVGIGVGAEEHLVPPEEDVEHLAQWIDRLPQRVKAALHGEQFLRFELSPRLEQRQFQGVEPIFQTVHDGKIGVDDRVRDSVEQETDFPAQLRLGLLPSLPGFIQSRQVAMVEGDHVVPPDKKIDLGRFQLRVRRRRQRGV